MTRPRGREPATLTFDGAAGTVTGSRYFVQAQGRLVGVDAGLFQGLKALRQRNWAIPSFDPASMDALFITHAHLDHVGYLPRLVRLGYRRPAYCTAPTRDLAAIILADAAKLQEEEAEFANRKGFSKHKPALPLFNRADAARATMMLKPVPYERWTEAAGVRARFHDAGHILGSSFLEMEVDSAGERRTLVFSGDLGRYSQPLHTDPDPLPGCDVLVMESTYGDRPHPHRTFAEQATGPITAALKRGGTVLIPAFAVARVQVLSMLVSQMVADGRLPNVPIHVDSPMATEATDVYERYRDSPYLDPEPSGTRDLPFLANVQFHSTPAESKRLNNLGGPRIIFSSSGMLTGGRVIHHLHRLLPDRRNLILLVGYQAEGTRGRDLLEGARTIRMFGDDVPVGAEVLAIEGLSAHADVDGLVRWVRTAPRPPGRVFLTHGEPRSAEALAGRLRSELHVKVDIPKLGESFALTP
ncbi:MAG TPA: MBL fold metallo-hydrolase [Tepidiformaceae bacterium]|nr:MBL fold metallo-hydrolase [Tepidiformaceae bacterium]